MALRARQRQSGRDASLLALARALGSQPAPPHVLMPYQYGVELHQAGHLAFLAIERSTLRAEHEVPLQRPCAESPTQSKQLACAAAMRNMHVLLLCV